MTTRYRYLVMDAGGADTLQTTLDVMAKDGWRYIGGYESMGYTVRLIFERPVVTPPPQPRVVHPPAGTIGYSVRWSG